jgi:hypothetical protein
VDEFLFFLSLFFHVFTGVMGAFSCLFLFVFVSLDGEWVRLLLMTTQHKTTWTRETEK